jgi:ornithine cyclodeaminase
MFRSDYESELTSTEGAMRYDTTHEGVREGRETGRPSVEGGSFLVDGAGTIVGFDDGMERLTGWTAADVVGRTAGTPILLDGGFVTDQRTGAAGGVAARWLAPEQVEVVALIGTGLQARKQVEALRVVRPQLREIRVWGRDPARAARAASDVGGVVVATVAEAARAADVVITCTASREPILMADDVRPGAHVTALGSDGIGKQELDPELLRRADLLVVDALEQCLRLGELQHAPEQADRAVEIGLICAGTKDGRTDDDQLTVTDLTGVGVQDVAAANTVLANVAPDAGEWIRL